MSPCGAWPGLYFRSPSLLFLSFFPERNQTGFEPAHTGGETGLRVPCQSLNDSSLHRASGSLVRYTLLGWTAPSIRPTLTWCWLFLRVSVPEEQLVGANGFEPSSRAAAWCAPLFLLSRCPLLYTEGAPLEVRPERGRPDSVAPACPTQAEAVCAHWSGVQRGGPDSNRSRAVPDCGHVHDLHRQTLTALRFPDTRRLTPPNHPSGTTQIRTELTRQS